MFLESVNYSLAVAGRAVAESAIAALMAVASVVARLPDQTPVLRCRQSPVPLTLAFG
jgi:hypothetical protein